MSGTGNKRVRPKVFIGSSTEGLEIAESLQVNLDYHCEARVWSQGVFEPGGSTLPSLVQAAQNADFAILVVSPDDQTLSRGTTKETARDNVIFELGLFMGVLGRERTFMVHDRKKRPDLPSDLLGVTPATYELHQDGNLDATLGAPTTQIKRAIQKLGFRTPPAPSDGVSRTVPVRTEDVTELNKTMDRIGKLLAQVLWIDPAERGARFWERLEKLGAPPALTDPIKKTVRYEAEVRKSLETLLSGFFVGYTFYADGRDDALATEFSIAAPDGRRVYIDLAPDLFIANGIDTIEVTMTTRVSMLKNDPYYAGQILVAKEISPVILEQVHERINQYPGALSDVRVVHYRDDQDIAGLLQAIQDLFASAPVPQSTSTPLQSQYRTEVLDILRSEIRNGPTARYLHPGDRYVSFGVDVKFDAFFERVADKRLIMVDVREGLYQDVEHGISELGRDLATLLQSDEFVANVGGLLIVTEVVPRQAIQDFVIQITEPQSPVPVVLADVTGPEQRDRLIEALRQVSHLPGQDYD